MFSRKSARSGVSSKWSKFSEQDLSALTGNGDLLNQVVAKYGLEAK